MKIVAHKTEFVPPKYGGILGNYIEVYRYGRWRGWFRYARIYKHRIFGNYKVDVHLRKDVVWVETLVQALALFENLEINGIPDDF